MGAFTASFTALTRLVIKPRTIPTGYQDRNGDTAAADRNGDTAATDRHGIG